MICACSRRRWLAFAAAALAGAPPVALAQTRIETRSVPRFQSLRWQASGELLIEQTGRERVSIEAEPTLLPRIVTEVDGATLSIRFAPGSFETRHPVRVRVEVASLESIEADGAGTLSVGALKTGSLRLRLAGSESLRLLRLDARSLDARLDGAGALTVDGGQVDRQHLVIAGAADYTASQLACREAVVSIPGAGTAWLAVNGRLEVAIEGSGDVLYLGQPQVIASLGGSGSVRRIGVDRGSGQRKP